MLVSSSLSIHHWNFRLTSSINPVYINHQEGSDWQSDPDWSSENASLIPPPAASDPGDSCRQSWPNLRPVPPIQSFATFPAPVHQSSVQARVPIQSGIPSSAAFQAACSCHPHACPESRPERVRGKPASESRQLRQKSLRSSVSRRKFSVWKDIRRWRDCSHKYSLGPEESDIPIHPKSHPFVSKEEQKTYRRGE